MEEKEVIQTLKKYSKVVPTGSFYICDPPHEDTDRDYFVLHSWAIHKELLKAGFNPTPDCSYEHNFKSYRRGAVNVITVVHEDDLDKVELATSVARHLNLHNKEDRLVVFNAIRYGVYLADLSTEIANVE